MKILQLGRFYPPSKGGVEVAIYNIREGLAELNVQCDVLCCGDKLSSSTEAVNNGVIYRAGSFGTLLSTSISPALVMQFKKIMARYDVIHIHHPDPMATLALFLWRPTAKVVVHWHSDIVRQKLSLKLFLPLQKWLLNYASRIIVTTPTYRCSRFLEKYANKVDVVPLGINPSQPLIEEQVLSNIKSRHQNKFLIFALGRMVYYKGFQYLIESAQQLNDNFDIVIGGDGILLDKLRTMVERLGVAHRVFLPGKLSDAEINAYYCACDVFCLSSTHPSEAFGIVQLEAMRFAKPIIATTINGSGVSWVNADQVTGINIKPKNSEKLAQIIQMFSEIPIVAQRMGRRGQLRLNDLFTRQRMGKSIFNIYSSILKESL